MPSLEIIIAVLHCFERKACLPMCFCDLVQLLLWIWSVPVSNAMDCETCVHALYCPTAWPRNVTSLATRHTFTQLLISIQKYKTVHVLGQQTWKTLVDSLPVGKTDVRKLPMTLELRENGGRRHSRDDSTMRRRCLSHIDDVTCYKFNNCLCFLKTSYQLETGKPAYRLQF